MLVPYSIAVERDHSLTPPSFKIYVHSESIVLSRLEALHEVLPRQGHVANYVRLSVLVKLGE